VGLFDAKFNFLQVQVARHEMESKLRHHLPYKICSRLCLRESHKAHDYWTSVLEALQGTVPTFRTALSCQVKDLLYRISTGFQATSHSL